MSGEGVAEFARIPKFCNFGYTMKTLLAKGNQSHLGQILTKLNVYVADSLGQAIREATPYVQNFNDVRNAADPNRMRDRGDLASQMEQRFIVAGDPQRCIDAIQSLREELHLTTLSGTFHFGGMPHNMAMNNIRRFADQVMPAFK